MAFNVNTFYSLNLNERIQLVNIRGEFITRIKYYGFYLNLYLVDKYFVEVYYNAHTNAIEEAELLEPKDERLDLYTADVSLNDLRDVN